MKKIISFILVLTMLLSFSATVCAENYNTPKIYLNGELFEFKGNKPILRNERVLVPLKSGVFQKVGCEVAYDVINKEATVKNKSHIIAMFMHELDLYNQGIRCYISDVRCDYLDGDAYVPMRAFFESLGYTVSFDDKTYSAYITR